MKSHQIHPHISEFDRIDHLPTYEEIVVAVRELVESLLRAVPLTWR